MSTKYFRMMESPKEDWGPYWQDPESGRRMEFNRHLDAMFASAPQKGDYLVLGIDGSISALRSTSYEQYRGVGFDEMPDLHTLLDKGVIVEVPEDIRMEDWHLQARIEILCESIDELEEKLEELEPKMHARRFGFLTSEAKECRHVYNELKPMFDGLCNELEQVREDMEEKVLKPLSEAVSIRKERAYASVDDLIFGASSRGAQVLGLKKDFNIEDSLGL